jgi:predicted DNA-binding transcriptional regulator AlpA
MTNNELMVQEGLITIEAAMDFLDISRASLYRLIKDGILPTVKLIGARRIPRRALIDLAASRVTVSTRSSDEHQAGAAR